MNMGGYDVMKELNYSYYYILIDFFTFWKCHLLDFFQCIQRANKEVKKDMNKWTDGKKILMCHLSGSEMGGATLLYMYCKNWSRLLHRTVIRTKWEQASIYKQSIMSGYRVKKKKKETKDWAMIIQKNSHRRFPITTIHLIFSNCVNWAFYFKLTIHLVRDGQTI